MTQNHPCYHYTIMAVEPSAGIEPASPTWKDGASPKMLTGHCVDCWLRPNLPGFSVRCFHQISLIHQWERNQNRTDINIVLQTITDTNIGYPFICKGCRNRTHSHGFGSRCTTIIRNPCCDDRIRTDAVLLPKQAGKTWLPYIAIKNPAN